MAPTLMLHQGDGHVPMRGQKLLDEIADLIMARAPLLDPGDPVRRVLMPLTVLRSRPYAVVKDEPEAHPDIHVSTTNHMKD